MTANIIATEPIEWKGELNHHKVEKIRLVVKDVSNYECTLQQWGVVLQYLYVPEDKMSDVFAEWWDYYTLCRFEFSDWACGYANLLSLKDIKIAIKKLDNGEDEDV